MAENKRQILWSKWDKGAEPGFFFFSNVESLIFHMLHIRHAKSTAGPWLRKIWRKVDLGFFSLVACLMLAVRASLSPGWYHTAALLSCSFSVCLVLQPGLTGFVSVSSGTSFSLLCRQMMHASPGTTKIKN